MEEEEVCWHENKVANAVQKAMEEEEVCWHENKVVNAVQKAMEEEAVEALTIKQITQIGCLDQKMIED